MNDLYKKVFIKLRILVFRYSLFSKIGKLLPYQFVNLVNRLLNTRLRVSKFVNIDQISNKSINATSDNVRIYSPSIYGKPEKSRVEEVADKSIYIHRLENFLVYPRSSLLINASNNSVFVEYNYTKSKDLIFKDDYIYEVVNCLIYYLPNKENIIKVKKGISLLGKGSWNYFHMLLEYLPKLYFIEDNKSEYTLLVNHAFRDQDSFMFLSGKLFNGEVLYVNDRDVILVDELIYVTTPLYLTFNKKTAFDLSDMRYNSRIIEWIGALNNILNEELTHKLEELEPFEKVFLSRSNLTRNYNCTGIEKIAENKGFMIVDFSELPFLHQIAIMRNAKFFVGPTGASLSNLVFCKAGTIGLTWMHSAWGEFPAYSTLAELCDVKLFYLQVKSSGSDYHGAYYLDEDYFSNTIDSIEKEYLSVNERV
ncbi:MAG: glycosyltransferase family 61 protein [Cyclobacteriaceae bacterium]|nr:glycosyltransferase family 61 protein [Cyclobacteriaceae bacterium]